MATEIKKSTTSSEKFRDTIVPIGSGIEHKTIILRRNTENSKQVMTITLRSDRDMIHILPKKSYEVQVELIPLQENEK